MAQVIITINYREYAISCENGEEARIIKLGRLLDEKARSLTDALGHINENQLLAMVGLLIADELEEAKKASPATQTAVAPKENDVSVETLQNIDNALEELDNALSQQLNSLNQEIKSVALKLKSL